MSTIKSSDEHLTLNADGASKDLKLQTNGTERAIVKADGKVGIGTSSPSGNLTVNSGSISGADTVRLESDNTVNSGSPNPQLVLKRNSNAAGRTGGVYFNAENSADAEVAYGLIDTQITNATDGSEASYLMFRAQNSGTLTNTLRVNSNGTINFPVSGGGIYLGGTTPANSTLLDDYETGTWTPTITVESGTAPTYTVTSAVYTKVGRLIHANVTINISAVGSGLLRTSFPFTPSVNYGYYGGARCADSSGNYRHLAVSKYNTSHALFTFDGGTTSTYYVNSSQIGTGQFHFSLSYRSI